MILVRSMCTVHRTNQFCQELAAWLPSKAQERVLLTLRLPSKEPVSKWTVVPSCLATAPVALGWKTCRDVTVLTKLSSLVSSWPPPRVLQMRTSVPPPLISNAPAQNIYDLQVCQLLRETFGFSCFLAHNTTHSVNFNDFLADTEKPARRACRLLEARACRYLLPTLTASNSAADGGRMHPMSSGHQCFGCFVI